MTRTVNRESEMDRLISLDGTVNVLSPRERCRQATAIMFMVFLGLGIGCVFVAIREAFGFKT